MELIASVPTTIGQDLAGFRAELGITQSQLATKSGVDQSRISRIEKGESGTNDEFGRILAALKSSGSKDAGEYEIFLTKDWQHVERPNFSNPQRNTLESAERVLRRIAEFFAEKERPWPLARQLEDRQAAIEASAAYLGKTSHQIAFIGEIGVGKSTAISFLYELLNSASLGSDLGERVVLETGGGYTTLCEVNLRSGPGFGIVVQAQSDEEMRNLIGDFCAVTWLGHAKEGQTKESVSISLEVQRALRNMSGLPTERERDAQGKRILRDSACTLASQCATEEEFRTLVTARMNLEQRTRREIWIEDVIGKTPIQQLRELFSDINNGRLSDVPLPASIDLLIPEFGLELPGLEISVVDTKGLDENAVRADLDARLKDSRTHVVLCSTFNQAPSRSTELLLDHLSNAHGIRADTGKVSVLTLPRDDEAMAVKDDSGEPPLDDKDGYDLKRDLIIRKLASRDVALSRVPILFFNAKKDDAAPIRKQLLEQIVRLRKSHEERLLDECTAAEEVIRNHETQAFTAAVQEVAARLGHFLGAYSSLPPRVRQPFQALMEDISEVRASTIWAMTRRNGEYYKFSVSHQIGAGGARDALLRSRIWFEKLQGVLDTLKQDPDLMLAQKTIQQVETNAAGWRQAFAEAGRIAAVEIYRGPLWTDAVLWSKCAAEWGKGTGFKNSVAGHIRDWFETQTGLNQKLESVMAALWEESVVRPLQRLSVERAVDLPERSGKRKAVLRVISFKSRTS